jgi:hypothetical protein
VVVEQHTADIVLVGTQQRRVEEGRQRHLGQRVLAAARSLCEAAAIPASASPDFSSFAFAIRSRRSGNEYRYPRSVVQKVMKSPVTWNRRIVRPTALSQAAAANSGSNRARMQESARRQQGMCRGMFSVSSRPGGRSIAAAIDACASAKAGCSSPRGTGSSDPGGVSWCHRGRLTRAGIEEECWQSPASPAGQAPVSAPISPKQRFQPCPTTAWVCG